MNGNEKTVTSLMEELVKEEFEKTGGFTQSDKIQPLLKGVEPKELVEAYKRISDLPEPKPYQLTYLVQLALAISSLGIDVKTDTSTNSQPPVKKEKQKDTGEIKLFPRRYIDRQQKVLKNNEIISKDVERRLIDIENRLEEYESFSQNTKNEFQNVAVGLTQQLAEQNRRIDQIQSNSDTNLENVDKLRQEVKKLYEELENMNNLIEVFENMSLRSLSNRIKTLEDRVGKAETDTKESVSNGKDRVEKADDDTKTLDDVSVTSAEGNDTDQADDEESEEIQVQRNDEKSDDGKEKNVEISDNTTLMLQMNDLKGIFDDFVAKDRSKDNQEDQTKLEVLLTKWKDIYNSFDILSKKKFDNEDDKQELTRLVDVFFGLIWNYSPPKDVVSNNAAKIIRKNISPSASKKITIAVFVDRNENIPKADLYNIYENIFSKLEIQQISEYIEKIKPIKLINPKGGDQYSVSVFNKRIKYYEKPNETYEQENEVFENLKKYGFALFSKYMRTMYSVNNIARRVNLDIASYKVNLGRLLDITVKNEQTDEIINFQDYFFASKFLNNDTSSIQPSSALPTFGSIKRALGVGKSIEGRLKAEKRTSKLATYLTLVGLDEVLDQNKGPFTVLAPSNKAFEKFFKTHDKSTLLDTMSGKALLKKLLLYHVYAGNDASKDYLGQRFGLSLRPTLFENREVRVRVEDYRNRGSIVIEDEQIGNDPARVIKADLTARNGTIHIIDGVLLFDGFEEMLIARRVEFPPPLPSPSPPLVEDITDEEYPQQANGQSSNDTIFQNLPKRMEEIADDLSTMSSMQQVQQSIFDLRNKLMSTDGRSLRTLYTSKSAWNQAHDALTSAYSQSKDRLENSSAHADQQQHNGDDEDVDEDSVQEALNEIYDSYFVVSN